MAENSEAKKRPACTPCKIIGLAVFALAGYGLYNLIQLF